MATTSRNRPRTNVRNRQVVFNRVIVPPPELAEFLRVGEGENISLTELQSKLYDQLYRRGAVRHLDGTRARRRRSRDRRRAN